MNAIDQIDDVLSIICTHYEKNRTYINAFEVKSALIKMHPDLNYENVENDLKRVTDKLIDDKYIEVISKNTFPVIYIATYDGLFFNLSGGYRSRLDREKWRTRSQNWKDALIVLGTMGVTIGLFQKMLVYLYKKGLHWILSINFFSVLILFLIGIITGIATILVAKEVLKRKYK